MGGLPARQRIEKACEDEAFQAALQRYAYANGSSLAIMQAAALALAKASNDDAQSALDGRRYRYLRERDLDTINMGGVFAGMTPENVVLNGEDLDRAVDTALLEAQEPGNAG